jgi:uncharacterized membrane protein YidH (DUF202 family)
MIYSKDSQFTEALENEEAFEKRLSDLRKARKVSFVSWIVTSLAFFVGCFSVLKVVSSGIQSIGPMAVVVPLMLFGSVSQLVSIVAVQSEIRALLAFKKLKEMQFSN